MMSEYMTIAGIIQFDPRDRTAGGKDIRDVAIRAIGNNKMVNITVWPENDDVPLAKGDFIVADGKFTQSMGQNKSGEQQTYYNLSANVIHNLTAGAAPTPKSAKKTKAAVADETPASDDFPF
jgi:hypothetical protein